MRFGFVTCVQLGSSCIEEIYAVGGHLDLLMTLRDDIAVNKSGRAYLDTVSSTHEIPLIKVRNINDPEALEALRAFDLDWLFIIGWSQIAGPEVLASPRKGVIGMHPTLLPEGRGRAAIPWAIIKGLKQTGVTMFVLDEGVDTGPILDQVVIPIGDRETAETLYERVTLGHRALIRKAWPSLSSGNVRLRVQDDSRASEWSTRRPSDGEILPDMTVAEVDRLVRAVTKPYPGAFWQSPSGEAYTVWEGRPTPLTQSQLKIRVADGVYYASVVERISPR